tara:strand:- start:255 stop:1343 length:1089 start_codon:yes stop_codon:yes gene_type:complete
MKSTYTKFLDKNKKLLPYLNNIEKKILTTNERKLVKTSTTSIKEYESYFNIDNYEELKEIRCSKDILKKNCKNNNLRISGNKPDLLNRLYNVLRWNKYSIKIQSIMRGNLRRKLNRLKRINFRRSKTIKCVNETDFLSLEPIKNIGYYQLVYLKDHNFNYAFDICSIYNMIIVNKCRNNPYTRQTINKKNIIKLKKIIRLSLILKDNIVLKLEDNNEELTEKQKIEFKTLQLFQKMDEYGYITDRGWFLNLSIEDLLDYVNHLLDIWNYRVEIPLETKRGICPPYGTILTNHYSYWGDRGLEYTQKKTLNVIEQMITTGTSEEYKKLGALYVLGAFTIVSQNAANSLPWLYETFRLSNQQYV